jgi:hypothetical protein
MTVKAVNDTIGPDGIVPTILVFSAYPRMMINLPLLALTTRRAEVIRKAIIDLRCAVAE